MGKNPLSSELSRFVKDHPQGWSHDEWLGLLFHLSEAGIDTADENGIGLALEHERLHHLLGKLDIKGLGPKRREALSARFGSLWALMEASPDEIAEVPGLPRTLALELSEALQ